MTSCLVGATHDDAVERARELYAVRTRPLGFEEWLKAFTGRALIGSVDEVAEQLRAYERAGCDRVMLQHLNHRDLESVRVIGRELAPAVA
jgi:alkanesulfonate monooxygenase SsuD/methylene tetrahydromethanopterin reductase-like flavin-dependent oxidoreductase (luciferase family)